MERDGRPGTAAEPDERPEGGADRAAGRAPQAGNRGGGGGEERPLLRDPNLYIVFAVTLMAVMGVSSIGPALPSIRDAFGITPGQAALLITVFTLPGIFITPFTGILADRYGRKTILVPSLFLFAVAGTSMAFVRDFQWLLVLRVLQGIGVTSLGSLNATVIGDLYGGRRRTAAMGYVASVLSIGTASYPVIGGALASLAWYAVFFLPALALPVGLAVLFGLRNPEPSSRQPARQYFGEAWRVVRRRTMLGLFGVSLLTFIILFGSYLTYFPFLLRERFGQDSLAIGLMMGLASATTALTSANLGRIALRLSDRQRIIGGAICYALSMALLTVVPSLPWVALPAVLFGFGQGINFPSVMALVAARAPMNQRAAVMAVNGTVLRIGQTVGPALMSLVYAGLGLEAVFWAGVAAAVLMAFVVFGAVCRPGDDEGCGGGDGSGR